MDANTIFTGILLITISISIFIVAFQIARFIGELANVVREARGTLSTANEIVDSVKHDYFTVRGFIVNLKNLSRLDFLKKVFNKMNSGNSRDFDDEI